MKRFLSRIAPIAFVTMASAGIYACSDSTGPDGGGGRVATITVQPVFQSPAASVVQFTQAHVIVRRSDGSVALDTTINYTGTPPGLQFDVRLSPLAGVNGENLTVEFDLLSASGSVVFHGGATSVQGNPESPASVNVSALFTGTGSNAIRVEITPATSSATTGATVDFTAKAFAADNTLLPGTPVQFTSLTPTLASVPNQAVGRAVMGATRGAATIRATLVTGQTADAIVNISLPASAIAIQSGNNQTLSVNSVAQPLVVKVTATDGLGVGGVNVGFAIQAGGGTLGATQATTDANGLATVGYTFGATPGAVTILASVQGLSGSPATFSLTGTSSAVTQLVFASQPTSAVVGSSIGTVTVEARDQSGNRVTTFTGSVNVALEAPPAGVTLQGTVTVNAVAGVATFTGLTVAGTGTDLRLRATTTGIPTVLSNTFAISPRPPTTLVFTSLPASGTAAGAPFIVVVQARDDLGNLATGYTGTVTIALDGPASLLAAAPPPGVVLNGLTSVAAVGGIATFANLSISSAAAALRFIATATGISGSVSSTLFAINSAANPLVASPLSTSFVVQRTAPSPSAAVVQLTSSDAITGLAVGTITYGPGATGWLVAGLSGAATPSSLTLTPSTSALPEGTFTATVPITGAGGVSLAYQVNVTITPLPVTQLVIITPPGGAASGANFGTQPVIELQDATNTRVFGATNVVTASIATGAGALGGTVARAAVQGRVTYNDLRITGTGAHTLTFTIAGPITVTSGPFTVNAALATTQAVPAVTGTAGQAIAPVIPVTAAGGVTPYVFAISAGLPAGLVFNTTTGQLTGTPAAPFALTNFTVTVTDAAATPSSKTFSLTINGPLTTTQAVPTKVGTVGAAIASFIPVTAAGGTIPYVFALSGGALPTGLTFNTTTGAISGTPTTTLAATPFTVTVTDNVGAISSKNFTLTVNAALVATQAVPTTTANAGAPLSFIPVTGSNGSTPYTFALTGTALPAGLTFNTTTGAVSGTPGVADATTVRTVTITDAAGAQASATFSLTVNGPLTTTQAIASRTVNSGAPIAPFTPVTAAGGTAPLTFSIAPSLPAALTINGATGEISGTPAAALAATVFTVTVTDNTAAQSSKTFTLTINGPLTTTQAVPTKVGTVGAAIASFIPVTAAGGTTPYSFALTGGTLPTGLTFNTTTGAIAGTPTTALGATVFTVTVTDATTAQSAQTFTLTVNPALTTTQAVPTTTGTVNTAIPAFTPVTAANGTTPYTFAITAGGALPAGMTLNTTTGQITGTPTVAQGATVRTITVTDAAGATSAQTFTLTVNAALVATQSVPTKVTTQGTAVPSFTPVTGSGGTTPYTFAITAGGALPAGLTLNTTTGAISGTPTATQGATARTITITDAVGATASNTFSLTVNATLVANQAVPTTTGNAGTPLASFIPVTGSNGSTPYTFAITAGGALPAGLAFNTTTGAVSGTPGVADGPTVRTVTITDAAGAQAAATFSLTINGPFSTTQAVPTTVGTVNTLIPTFTPVTAGGGTIPYTFALSGGTLPTGMNFNTTNGQVSGTPTTTLVPAGTFTVTVTDNVGAISSKTFQLTVNVALVANQAIASRSGTQNTLMSAFTPITATGGTSPFTFAITAGGALPTGLTLNTTTGQITGTPTVAQGATVRTITITDAAGATAANSFTLTINAALGAAQSVPTTTGTQNTAITAFTPVTPTNGTSPFTFAITAGGALPTGLTLNTTTGQITGTPTVAQGATVRTITITDAAGATAANTFSLTINAGLTAVQSVASRTGTQNAVLAAFTPVTASGGTAPFTFAITAGGALPAGLTLNTTTGQITGTPTVAQGATVRTITITDAASASASNTFSLTINAALVANQAVPTTTGTQNAVLAAFTPVTATAGTAPYTFAITAGGALPTGLTLNTTTGQITGTPTVAQGATVRTITITDAAGATAANTFSLTINAALVANQAVPTTTGTQNTPLAAFTPVTPTNGTAPYTFAITAGGALPAGLTLNTTTGQITGTPTVAQGATVRTITITDAAGATAANTFSLTINGVLTATQAVASRTTTVNRPFFPTATFTPVTASGGTAPYTFAITAGGRSPPASRSTPRTDWLAVRRRQRSRRMHSP